MIETQNRTEKKLRLFRFVASFLGIVDKNISWCLVEFVLCLLYQDKNKIDDFLIVMFDFFTNIDKYRQNLFVIQE